MSTLLKAHMDIVEKILLAKAAISANTGHSIHKGTPREAFIKEFLTDHLSERVAIGHGEIIDAISRPNEPRNQMDTVLYKREYPKINFGGEVYGFLVESVVATIEVKSTLTKEELKKAVQAANVIKQLSRSIFTGFTAGYQPPSILSYVVAYDGPEDMKTVYQWLTPIHRSLDIPYPPVKSTWQERTSVASPSLDGIFVLGKGLVLFDNQPIGWEFDELRKKIPEGRWIYANIQSGNLLLLFLLLTYAINAFALSVFDPNPYLPSLGTENKINFGI